MRSAHAEPLLMSNMITEEIIMFKKILSFALVIAMILSVAMIAASAAETDAADIAADAPAEVGADAPAETGAGNIITFDPASAGWKNYDYISFHIWAIDDSDFQGFDWGGKKQRGTKNDDGTWSYDLDKVGTIKSGCQYCVIFYSSTGSQTYNLLFGTPCIGKKAYCDGTTFENPEDSNKTALAAVWEGISASTYGPELKISSIGNVVGSCCAASTTPYKMFVEFLTNTLDNARQYSGKNDQTLIDDTASKLGIGQDDIEKAIKEAGATVDWKKAESKAPEKSDPEANQPGNDPSGPASKTGQDAAPIYIMLAVLVASAGVIFFARKREHA